MVHFNDVLGVMITASILIMSSGGNLPIVFRGTGKVFLNSPY